MKRAGMFVLLAVLCAAATAQAGERRRLKEYLSPDSGIVARILTVSGERGRNAESNVEFRRRSDRKLIGAKSFMSNDHQHGLGVLKAGWSPDANFFVFSMVSSGGQYPGVFPSNTRSPSVVGRSPVASVGVVTIIVTGSSTALASGSLLVITTLPA